MTNSTTDCTRAPIPTVAVIDEIKFGTADQLCQIVGDRAQVIDATSPSHRYEICQTADILVTESWLPSLSESPQLKYIQLLSVGYEHIDFASLPPDWIVTHSGGASAVPIAEWCLGMMLYFSHRFADINNYQRARSWYSNRISDMTSQTLRNKTVGIIGYGAIGRELARQCKSMGMAIHATLGRSGKAQPPAYRTQSTGDPDGQLPEEWFSLSELKSVIHKFDFIVLGLRDSDNTKNLIDEAMLKRCRPDSVLINPSRGAVVDENALVQALHAGTIAGAALDVFKTEPLPATSLLYDAPNIVISPHCSPESKFFRDEQVNCMATNIFRFADNLPLINVARGVLPVANDTFPVKNSRLISR